MSYQIFARNVTFLKKITNIKLVDFGADYCVRRQQPLHRNKIRRRTFDKLPPLIEPSPLMNAIHCHSVISSPLPRSSIELSPLTSQPEIPIENTWVSNQQALKPRKAIQKRVVIPKPKTKAESALDITKTRKYIKHLEKEEKKYEDRNTVYDETGKPKDIDAMWTSPLSSLPPLHDL